MKKTVAVDFDGVLHSYTSGWTGIEPTDPPCEGAVGFIQGLSNNYTVVVVSSRAIDPGGAFAIERWLQKHGFPKLDVTSEKVPAVAYIDDRAVVYDGDFASCFEHVEALARTRTGQVYRRDGTGPWPTWAIEMYQAIQKDIAAGRVS